MKKNFFSRFPIETICKFALLCYFLSFTAQTDAQNWDVNTLHKFNSIDNRFIRSCSTGLSASGPYLAVGVPIAMAVYAGIDKNQQLLQDAVYIGSSVLEAATLTYALKYAAGRERPYEKYPNLIHPYSQEDSPSFPSGHTASAFSLATSLSIRYPKWYVIAPSMLWATGVGCSRLTEGVHYPSDVMAGAVIGAGCAVINIYINRWLNRILFEKH